MYSGDGMRKTTVLLDEDLLTQAMEAIGARSKREAITLGLQHLVRQRNRKLLQKELGTFEIDLTVNELEHLRDAD